MLQRSQNLRNLKFTESSSRFEDRDEESLCLDDLLSSVRLPLLRVLHLSSWSIIMGTITKSLPTSFPALVVLDIEMLDLHSDDVNA